MPVRPIDEDSAPVEGSLLPAWLHSALPGLRITAAAGLVLLAVLLVVAPQRVAPLVDGSAFAPAAPLGTPAAAARNASAATAEDAATSAAAAATGQLSVHANRPATLGRPATATAASAAGTLSRSTGAAPGATAGPAAPAAPAAQSLATSSAASSAAAAVSASPLAPTGAVESSADAASREALEAALDSSDPMATVRPETVTSEVAVPLPGTSSAADDDTPTPSTTAASSAGSTGSTGGSTAGAGTGSSAVSGAASQRFYGTSRSGLPWHSGFWTGGYGSAEHILAAQQWRGTGMDFVTTYPAYATWNELATDTFAVATFDGFPGRLSYGLPLLPQDRRGQWGDVTSGERDEVFRGIARLLVAHGRGDSVIRVGLEANGSWFPWGVTADTAAQFRAAFRRVVTVMRAEAPDLTFWFDTAAGSPLSGSAGRTDALTVLYPGDDVVDGISMDHFDFYNLVATTDSAFAAAMRPSTGPGLADAAEFARARGKGFGVPEWGLHSVHGPGDNPFFIRSMYAFFQANADVLVFENYFNEPDSYIANALFEAGNNSVSAAAYLHLWGRRSG